VSESVKLSEKHVLSEGCRADSTISLRSSLYEGVSENGRKYHRYREGSEYFDWCFLIKANNAIRICSSK
jgi:hypothetical protein